MAVRLAAPFEARQPAYQFGSDASEVGRHDLLEEARALLSSYSPVNLFHSSHQEDPPSPSSGRKRKVQSDMTPGAEKAPPPPPRLYHDQLQRVMKHDSAHAQHARAHAFSKRALEKRALDCKPDQADSLDCFKPVVLAPVASTSAGGGASRRTKHVTHAPASATVSSETTSSQRQPQQGSLTTSTRPPRRTPTRAILAPGDPTPTYTYDPVALSILSAARSQGAAYTSIVSLVSQQFESAASVVASRDNPVVGSILPSINSLFSEAASVVYTRTATDLQTTTSAAGTSSATNSSATSRNTSSVPRPTTPAAASKESYAERHKGAIIGGSMGGAAGLALLILLACCLWRRRRKTKDPVTPSSFDDGTGRAIDAPIMTERNESLQGSFGTSPSAVGVAYSPSEPRSRWGRRSLLDVMTAVIPGRGRTPIPSGSSFGGGHEHEPQRADIMDWNEHEHEGGHPVSYISHQPSIYSDGTYQPGMPRPVTAQYDADGNVMPAIRAVSPDQAYDPFRPQPMRTETEYISAEEAISSASEEDLRVEEMGYLGDSPEQQAVNFGSSSGSSGGNGTHNGRSSGEGGRTPTIGSQTRGPRGATPSVNSRSSTPSGMGGAGHGQSLRKDGSWW